MQNPDVSQVSPLRIQRVSAVDFPFDQAILLEECSCWDVDTLRQHYKGKAIFLVATGVRSRLDDVLEEAAHEKGESLLGFLTSSTDCDEDGEAYGSLVDLAVSCIEEDSDAVRVALIRRWKEECRRELLDGLRASVLPEEERNRALLLGEKFDPIGTCPCCDAEVLEWRAEVQQSRAL